MKCARLNLQERSKSVNKTGNGVVTRDKPRRYCQKRLVNPDHEEDPRWIDLYDRFHCNDSCNLSNDTQNSKRTEQDDLFLSVLNLKFQGDENDRKRPRTSFKYKTLTDGNTHRMFVKQVVMAPEPAPDDRDSQLTCYYYDDYEKYISNSAHSRPNSGKSNSFFQGVSTRFRENKAVQVDIKHSDDIKKPHTLKQKIKKSDGVAITKQSTDVDITETVAENTKISFYKSGKRKSLTISRTQSPETVQVIRVDVVCNHSGGSVLSDYDSLKSSKLDNTDTANKKIDNLNIRNSHFANKYLLTNTMKTLDENVSGGAKVTLLCKTFKLTDRSRSSNKITTNVTSSHKFSK